MSEIKSIHIGKEKFLKDGRCVGRRIVIHYKNGSTFEAIDCINLLVKLNVSDATGLESSSLNIHTIFNKIKDTASC